jgi:hypothetical protein
MHAQMNLLKTKLTDSVEASEKAQERLDLAENRIERLRMESEATRLPVTPVSEGGMGEVLKVESVVVSS